MQNTATLKKSIKPVTFTITVTARKVNENGTFSAFEVQSVKSNIKNNTLRVVAPPQGGGSLYIKCDSLDGLELMADNAISSMATRAKLF